jgi:hypothetical protein
MLDVFLNFVSSMNNAMYIGQHFIVIDCIHILCILLYIGLIFFAWMLICVMIVTRVLYVSDLFHHWLEHSISKVCECGSHL